ncbi:MAG: U32 family peptidase [Erysipelotrichaceae bacterium]|jgi:putative protease
MKIVSSVFEEQSVDILKKLNITHILVNEMKFSSGIKGFDLTGLENVTLRAHQSDLQVIVKADRLFDQSELDELVSFLKYLDSIGVDSILFSDLTVKMLIDEYDLKMKTIYAPETLLTNKYDVKQLQSDGFDSCVISKDIPLTDMYEIAAFNKDYCYLRVHGPILISYSLRRFISVYLNQYKEYTDHYYLCEENRNTMLPIVEKETGTWLYGDTLQSISEISNIIRQPLKGIIFDNMLYDDKYTVEVIKIYLDVLNKRTECQSALEELLLLEKKIVYTDISEIKKTALDKE